MEILSIISISDSRRLNYLRKSYLEFHRLSDKKYQWVVVDGSPVEVGQSELLQSLGVNHVKMPNALYIDRLRRGLGLIKSKYCLFFPDDYRWVTTFPFATAIREMERLDISQLKLSCRGMKWFAQPGATPSDWIEEALADDSRRWSVDAGLFFRQDFCLRRGFHEQVSLGCTVSSTEFIRSLVRHWAAKLIGSSPSALEKLSYIRLPLINPRYRIGYFKFITPAFHYIESDLEGVKNFHKSLDALVDENVAVANDFLNARSSERVEYALRLIANESGKLY